MVGSEQSYRLPFEASSCFVSLFEQLETSKRELAVSSYGISVTTLEEVFIRVGKGTEDEEDRQHLSSIRLSTKEKTASRQNSTDFAAGDKTPIKEGLADNRQVSFADDDLLLDQNDVGQAFLGDSGNVSEKRVFMTHTKALLRKRLIYGMRDKKSFCFQLVIPTILVLLGMILLTVRNNADQQSIVLADSAAKFNSKLSTSLRNPVPVYIENANTHAQSVVDKLSPNEGGESR